MNQLMTMRGVIVVLFGFPLVLNLGLSKWLVPGFQVVIGEWTVIWTGFHPISPMFGRMHPMGMPLFMIALTMTSLSSTDTHIEGDLEAHGPFVGVTDDEPTDTP